MLGKPTLHLKVRQVYIESKKDHTLVYIVTKSKGTDYKKGDHVSTGSILHYAVQGWRIVIDQGFVPIKRKMPKD